MGKLQERRLYAIECICVGCDNRVLTEVPAEVAKRYMQGTEIHVACDGCGQRAMVGKSLVLS